MPILDDLVTFQLEEKIFRARALTFVMDYWQLAFDGHVFSIMTWLAVSADDRATRSGEDGFRDRLCSQITKIVSGANFVDKVLKIAFEDGSTIRAFARATKTIGSRALRRCCFRALSSRRFTSCRCPVFGSVLA